MKIVQIQDNQKLKIYIHTHIYIHNLHVTSINVSIKTEFLIPTVIKLFSTVHPKNYSWYPYSTT
jgi:hypothetical protein